YGSCAPDRHGVGGLDVALCRRLPAGGQDVAKEKYLLVGKRIRHTYVGRVSERDAHVLGLPARIPARDVAVAKQAGGGVSEHLACSLRIAVRALAHGEIAAPALIALAANDRERDHHAIPGT